jgi:hypothetical protein
LRTHFPRRVAAAVLAIAALALSACSPVSAPVAPDVPTMTFTPRTSTTSALETLSSSAGATIYFSTDGTAPSLVYTGEIPLYGPGNVTVKTYSSAGGVNSGTATSTYTSVLPFTLVATIDPATRNMTTFNTLALSAYWDISDNLDFTFTTGSALDNQSWTCAIAGYSDVSATANGTGMIQFPYASRPASPATAKLTLANGIYFEVTW